MKRFRPLPLANTKGIRQGNVRTAGKFRFFNANANQGGPWTFTWAQFDALTWAEFDDLDWS